VTMIVKGVKAKSIADTFCISAKTVNSYRYRIFEKLHINSDVELAILAIKYRMFDLDELTLSAHK
jgi:two-component system invasion response regulator UvrY